MGANLGVHIASLKIVVNQNKTLFYDVSWLSYKLLFSVNKLVTKLVSQLLFNQTVI